MTAPVLMDHVSAYAAAVRAHLADLSPEQVDDLTDGLEADLAEALEDPRGPVATGEIPIGRPSDTGAGRDAIIDLTQRFGPAAAYAAELRSAAGVEPAQARPRRRPLLDGAAGLRGRAARWAAAATQPLRTSPTGRALVGFAASLRPLWWVLRAWVLFAALLTGSASLIQVDQPFVPRTTATWLLLGLLVLASVQVGRGIGRRRRWTRRGLAGVNVAAVVLALPMLAAFDTAVHHRLASTGAYPVYIQGPATSTPPENGVFVDGMQVSNLFVYDAAGEPLSQVQIFDDRGRPVRTTYDNGVDSWSLPGVADPWMFTPSLDTDGRTRWNVYPLSGRPASELAITPGFALPEPIEGSTPRVPPAPFAQAPAIATTAQATSPAAAPAP
ncbi:hypothetical protein [Pengzhenrongella sicca]|uniref:Uncharacterized protein n=1 Tax=Pengzhenrongella sicca TaxID=2819238 RepID=A0A8A4ZAN4_9MICO|nr:hypothetical protein [Pengzhenrongella sicca]QTE28982.1 hypothetical protein J4E96_16980 [Pengzhenrongella sicca]